MIAWDSLSPEALAHVLGYLPVSLQAIEQFHDACKLQLIRDSEETIVEKEKELKVLKIDFMAFKNKLLESSGSIDDYDLFEKAKLKEMINGLKQENLRLQTESTALKMAAGELKVRLEEVNLMLKDASVNRNEEQLSYGKNLSAILDRPSGSSADFSR